MRMGDVIAGFWGLRPPPRERTPRGLLLVMLTAGTFLVFSQIGFLSSLARSQTLTLSGACLSASFGGLYASGYMLAGVFRQWWAMVPIAIFQFFFASRVYGWMSQIGLFSEVSGDEAMEARGMTMFVAIVCLAVGFALMMRTVMRLGRIAARDQAELAVAQRVHRQLVPAIAVQAGDAAVDGVSVPSSAMGGDLIEVIASPAWSDVVIADISGHGVGPGLVMGMLKSALRTRVMQIGGDERASDLAAAAADVRQTMEGLLEPGRFATLAWVRVHHASAGGGAKGSRESMMEIVMAGHPPVLVRRMDGRLEKFDSEQPPIGAGVEEALGVRRSVLAEGDVLAMTTDGLAETFDKRGKQLGFDGVERVFEKAASKTTQGDGVSASAMGKAQRAAMIRERLLGAAEEFGKQSDDRSVLIIVR